MAGAQGKKFTAGSLSLLCFLGICLKSVVCQRKLTTVNNPGCNIASCQPGYEGAALNVAYVKSEGENDTLHYLISSVGGPSILVLQTLPGTKDPVKIDWNVLKTGTATNDITQAITVTRDVRFSFGVAFTQLYEDTAMTSDLNQTEAVSYRFDQLLWEGIAGQPQMSAENAVVFRASLSMPNVRSNGSVSVKFTVLNDADSETDYSYLPHLLYNNNLTRVDITLNDESPRPTEFGLEIVVISQDRFTGVVTDSNDTTTEGYVPGAFKITDYVTKEANSKDDGNFHWTPTCNRRLTPGQSEEIYKYERTYMLMTPEDNFVQSLPEVAKSLIHRYYAGVSSKLAHTVQRVALGSQCATWYFGMTSSYRDSSQHATCSSGAMDFRQSEVCYGLCSSPHLDSQQKERCQRGSALPEVSSFGADVEADACQFQFAGRRWNCPSFNTRTGDREEPSIKGLSVAYMYAMSHTATMHSVTLTRPSCKGEVTQCGCHKGTELEHALGAFGSCLENVQYLDAGEQQVNSTRLRVKRAGAGEGFMFVWGKGIVRKSDGQPVDEKDQPEMSTRAPEKAKNGGEEMVYVWGKGLVTRKDFQKSTQLLCKCYGVSGSCPAKICWLKKKKFRLGGSSLKLKRRRKQKGYRGDRKERGKKRKNVLRAKMYEKGKKKPPQVALVLPEVRRGACHDAPGRRRGKRCKKDSKGRSGCDFLCCGRGFHTVEAVQESKCECTFHWCCEIKCKKICKWKVEIHYCN